MRLANLLAVATTAIVPLAPQSASVATSSSASGAASSALAATVGAPPIRAPARLRRRHVQSGTTSP
jgi:hypothetical protein